MQLNVQNKLFFSEKFVPLQVSLLVLGITTEEYHAFTIIETCFLFFMVIDKLGKGIILRELIAFHAAFVLLLMPTIGYWYYSINNPLAKHWSKFMPIVEGEYFGFVFPAILIFNLILCWPIAIEKNSDFGGAFLENFKNTIKKLSISKLKVKTLLLSGTLAYFSSLFLPSNLQYVGYLAFSSSFVAFLMLYLDKTIKYRKLVMLYFIAFLLFVTIRTTMFTLVTYMGMTIFPFSFLNVRYSFKFKLGFFFSIALFLMTIQHVKGTFRNNITNISTQNKVLYLGDLLIKEASNSFSYFSSEKFFGFYIRANQGFIVAKVIDYIPQKKNHDNGEYLGQAIIASLVPRIFWPDKPQAGGKFTFKYFTGDELVGYTSMNVSPVGEAYGSFGPRIGILYLVILALFIRGMYFWFISLSKVIPFLIFWFPVIFYQLTYSMETDSLQIFNSLFKSGIFVFILYTISPSLFGVERKTHFSTQTIPPT